MTAALDMLHLMSEWTLDVDCRKTGRHPDGRTYLVYVATARNDGFGPVAQIRCRERHFIDDAKADARALAEMLDVDQ